MDVLDGKNLLIPDRIRMERLKKMHLVGRDAQMHGVLGLNLWTTVGHHGHALIADALELGYEQTVSAYLALCNQTQP